MAQNRYIAVLGSINADLVTGAERSPAPGETLLARSFQTFPGGKGANQAVAVARLGQRVEFLGCTGEDVFAPMLRDSLVRAGVGISALETVSGASGIATITTVASGENHILLVPGANDHVTPAYVQRHRDLLCGASMVLTQLETPIETLRCLAEVLEAQAIPLMLDPAPARTLPEGLLRKVAWLTPNQTEAAFLTGRNGGSEDPFQELALLDDLASSAARNILVKLGSRGVYAATQDGRRYRLPAFPVRAVDSTAAGDAFNGGFAAALVQGLDTAAALRMGSAVAAISVTRAGAQPSLPSREEVDAFLEQHSGGATQ